MGDLELGAAIEAAFEAIRADRSAAEYLPKRLHGHVSELVLTAALPHIELAVIQRLIEKLDTQIDMALLGGDEDDIIATEWQERALDWLRAELGERGGDA